MDVPSRGPLSRLCSVAVQPATQPHGALHDHVEHRLHVRRRAGDHAQDLAARPLLLQRLRQRRPKTFVLLDELSRSYRHALLLAPFIALTPAPAAPLPPSPARTACPSRGTSPSRW